MIDYNKVAYEICLDNPETILDMNSIVPEWLSELSYEMRFDIISGYSLSRLTEKYNEPESFFMEAYNKISPYKKTEAKALKDFPVGKVFRGSGQSGVTDGKGTFFTGEEDYETPKEKKIEESVSIRTPMTSQKRRIYEMIQNRRKQIGI